MNGSLANILKSRAFALFVHVLLWGVLYLVLSHTGTRLPDWTDESTYSMSSQDIIPVSRMGPLFSPAGLLSRASQTTNETSMFYTAYFVPAPKPVPPAPTTLKIPVTYLGFFETASGQRQVILKAPGGFSAVPLGGAVLTNFFVAEADMQMLLLTNAVSHTNLLIINSEMPLEIPFK